MEAFDAPLRSHATNSQTKFWTQLPVSFHRLIEADRKFGVVGKTLLERLDSTLPLQDTDGMDEAWTREPVGRRKRRTVWRDRRLFDHNRPAGDAATCHTQRRIRRSPQLLLQARQVCLVNHGHSVRGRSLRTHGETVSVRKLIIIGVVALLAVLFVQPIRAYRAAQSELTTARQQLDSARVVKDRAIKERDALGTREMLVREARRRGYIFPGETPFSVGNR